MWSIDVLGAPLHPLVRLAGELAEVRQLSHPDLHQFLETPHAPVEAGVHPRRADLDTVHARIGTVHPGLSGRLPFHGVPQDRPYFFAASSGTLSV